MNKRLEHIIYIIVAIIFLFGLTGCDIHVLEMAIETVGEEIAIEMAMSTGVYSDGSSYLGITSFRGTNFWILANAKGMVQHYGAGGKLQQLLGTGEFLGVPWNTLPVPVIMGIRDFLLSKLPYLNMYFFLPLDAVQPEIGGQS